MILTALTVSINAIRRTPFEPNKTDSRLEENPKSVTCETRDNASTAPR